MLEVKDLNVGYGKVPVLRDVSLNVDLGEIVAVIGANGAGKSTLLKSIVGLITPTRGQIIFDGKDVTKLSADRSVKLGMCLVPEGRQVFASLSVEENLLMGTYGRGRGVKKSEIAQDFDFVYSTFPRLEARRGQSAGSLSGGEQQMLAIGRALMARPKLLLLDETSLGLAPLLVKEIYKVIDQLNKQGIPALLVEEHALVALKLATRAYVLETGKVVLEGKGSELLEKEEFIKAYLGD